MVKLIQNRNLVMMDVESISTLQEIFKDFGYYDEAQALSCRPQVMDQDVTERLIDIGLLKRAKLDHNTVIYSTPKFWYLNRDLRKKLTDAYPELADYVRALEYIYNLQKTV